MSDIGPFTVTSIDGDHVTVDFNHKLAENPCISLLMLKRLEMLQKKRLRMVMYMVLAGYHLNVKDIIILNYSSFDESPTTGIHMADERKTEWKTLSGIDIPRTFSNVNTPAGQPPYTAGTRNNVSL